ncbi:MAG: AAA domain-containing protein [Nitrososphaeraceae archaeon]
MSLRLDTEQLRILKWRINSKGIAACIGPPGCGKTTTGSALAVKLVAEGITDKLLLVAYTNAAVNEFAWEICNIMGPTAAREYCIRTGNRAGIDCELPIEFSINAERIRAKKIVLCTTLSLKRLSSYMRFDNMIIDEAGIERLEHLLAPFVLGVNQLSAFQTNDRNCNSIDNLIDLASSCGIVATVIGDPKQSRPMGLEEYDRSAIEWVLKYGPKDTLRITHRLPDKLSGLVNDFARYDGLRSSPDIASRRLILDQSPNPVYRDIIDPEEVVTWLNINGEEKALGQSSWANDIEAKVCAKICQELRYITKKSIAIVTRFSEQRRILTRYVQRSGLLNIKVSTTTGALGTQADIVLFSLVRSNPERIVGQAGTLQDLNVAISRAKEKLIIVGNFDMMLNGWSRLPSNSRYGYKSPSRRLAQLIDSKYGKLIDPPSVLCE